MEYEKNHLQIPGQQNQYGQPPPTNYSTNYAPPVYSNQIPPMNGYDSEKPIPVGAPVVVQPTTTTTTATTIVYPNQGHLIIQRPYVQDTLILSIVSMLFCVCLGLASLIKSLGSRTARNEGNLEMAQQKAITARKLAIAAIIIGVICGVVGGIIRVVATAIAHKHH